MSSNYSNKTRAGNGSYIKHATLRKTGDRLEMWIPKQRVDDKRDTECVYGCYDNILTIGGEVIEKHPKFPNVGKFESWCSKYIAEH